MDYPTVEIKGDVPKSWWCGDSRVEPYMGKINKALDRVGVKGQHRTDIYNRCYEAIYQAIVDYAPAKNKESQPTANNK